MLSKQQEIVDHGPQLQVVIHSPADHETAEDRGAQHEEPFLDPERDQPHNHRSHHSSDDRNVDMLAEERDINGSKDKPRQEKTDAGTGEKNPNVVDTDSEDSADDSHNNWDTDSSVWDPGLVEVVRGEGEDREIGEGTPNDKSNEEQDNLDEPVPCGRERERNREWGKFRNKEAKREGKESYVFVLFWL